MADITSYFSGPPLDFKNLPMGLSEEEKKKRAAGAAAPSGQLPAAKPKAPVPKVSSVVSGAGGPPERSADFMQRSVDVRPSIRPSAMEDVTGKIKEFLTRQLTPEEEKQPVVGNKDPEKLKRVPQWMKDMAAGARGER
jgi:hypothetical protein